MYLLCILHGMYFRKYILLMDEVYTVCEDWGEGSGLQIWDTDCNVSDPGQHCLHYAIFLILRHLLQILLWLT